MRLSIANHNEAKNPKGFMNYEIDFMDIPSKVKSGFSYSACKFKDNYRKDDNYLGGEDVLILDIDNVCDVEMAKKIFSSFEYWIITTKNHQKLKNDITCDRFRIFLLLDMALDDVAKREIFINNIMERYPFVDTSCRNRSRFYYASPSDALCFYNKGSNFKIVDLDFTYTKKIEPKEKKVINLDDVFVLDELKGIWINKYGETLDSENADISEAEYFLKGAKSFLDTNFYKGNRNNAIFGAICMLLNDGLDDKMILDFIIAENDMRGKIPFNELMACFKSAKRTI